MTTGQGTDTGAKYDASTPGAPPAEKASIAEDFVDIFYAPSTVFARRSNGSYGLTLLIVSVLAALFTFAARGLLGPALEGDMTRAMTAAVAKNPQLTPDRIQSMVATQMKISMFVMFIATPIAVFVVAFFSWLAAKVVSAKINWAQAMAIVTLAFIPRLVNSLILAVQSLLTDAATTDSMMKLSFSPARFLSIESSKALLATAARFDVFVLWSTVLIGIGIAVMGKVPRSKGFIAAALVWLVAGLFGIVPALISG